MSMLEMSPLMEEVALVDEDRQQGSSLVPRVLNHTKFDDLDRVLKMPMGGLQAPTPPSSTTDGEIYGAR